MSSIEVFVLFNYLKDFFVVIGQQVNAIQGSDQEAGAARQVG